MPLLSWTKLQCQSMLMIVSLLLSLPYHLVWFKCVTVCLKYGLLNCMKVYEISRCLLFMSQCFIHHNLKSNCGGFSGDTMLSLVKSCIGTKFTSQFGNLIAVSLDYSSISFICRV